MDEYVFSLVEIPKYIEKAQYANKRLLAFAYDTIVHAQSGHVTDEQQVVFNDTYKEVITNIKETLKDVKSDYTTGKSDILTMVETLKKDLEEKVIPTWNYLDSHADKYVNQIFQDATSERIYTFAASMEVLRLLSDLEQFFNGKIDTKDRGKFMYRMTEKCLQYSKDKLFATTAGKPMRDIGYADISNVYEVAALYGKIVTAIQSDQVKGTITSYKRKVSELENHAETLDMEMKRNISRAEAIDDFTLKQYQDILMRAGALKTIYRATMIMSALLSSMQKTVHNLLDAAKNAVTTDTLKNMTEPMGGTLNPTIIETQAISNESYTPYLLDKDKMVGAEGFFKRIMDRMKTFFQDGDTNWLNKDSVVVSFMDFIREHISDADIAKYCASRKWKCLPLKDIEKGVNDLIKVVQSQEKFIAKVDTATTFEDIFSYPVSKGFNIPEIMNLHNVVTKLGTTALIGWTDRYTGEFKGMVPPDKVKNITTDENYSVFIYYRDEGYPLLVDYLNAYERLTKMRRMTGTQLDITNSASLQKWADLSLTYAPKTRELFERYINDLRATNKNTSSITNSEMRDKVVSGYYRTRIWGGYISIVVGMLVWGINMPYILISDIKKYA